MSRVLIQDFTRKLLVAVFLTMACLTATTSHAQTEEDRQRQSIIALLQLSGLHRQLEEMPEVMRQQMAADEDLSPEDKEQLLSIMLGAFDKDLIIGDVVAFFQADPGVTHVGGTIQMLSSPLARRMIELEVQTSSAEGQADFQAWFQTVKESPPPQERIALAQQLNQTINYAESSLETYVIMITTMVRTGMAIEGSVPADSIDIQVAAIEAGARAQLSQTLPILSILELVHMYQDASDDDLTQYIGMWETEEGQWFSRTGIGALLVAVKNGGERAMVRIMDEMKKPKTDDEP